MIQFRGEHKPASVSVDRLTLHLSGLATSTSNRLPPPQKKTCKGFHSALGDTTSRTIDFSLSGPGVDCLFVELLLPRRGCPCAPVQRSNHSASLASNLTHHTPRSQATTRKHKTPCTECRLAPERNEPLPQEKIADNDKSLPRRLKTEIQPLRGGRKQGEDVFSTPEQITISCIIIIF